MRVTRLFTAAAVAVLVGASAILTSGAVPAVAQTSPSTSPNGPFSSDKSGSAAIAPQKSAPLDLNAAEEAEFASLPGVGGPMAKAIVAGRPYKSKRELLDRRIVPAGVYRHIKSLVTVK